MNNTPSPCIGCGWIGNSAVCAVCPHTQPQPIQPTPQPSRESKESAFQSRLVSEIAIPRGWWVWHDRSKKTNRKGFLDLFLLRERLVIAELKRVGECMTDEQQEIFDKLKAAGVEVYLWVPTDWREIERILS